MKPLMLLIVLVVCGCARSDDPPVVTAENFCAAGLRILNYPTIDPVAKLGVLEKMRNRGCLN